MLDAIKHITDDNFFSFRKTAHWYTRSVHATQSNCRGALDVLSPRPYPSPNIPDLNALITRSRESYSSVSTSRESKRLNKLSSVWLISGKTLIQHLSENAIFVFPRFCQVV